MRKIINPPNMGTKSDPGIKITIPERKKESPFPFPFSVSPPLLLLLL
jgi:hypothetical protein